MDGISIIIPIYNEEDNVVESYQELTEVMAETGWNYELLFVDDGSRDNTLKNLMAVSNTDSHVRIIEFRRNFGQTAAMAAGLEHSRFEIVATLDGDLQNDPREIPRMVAKLKQGYDMVAGWRSKRKDKFISRRLPSMIANWVISRSTNVQRHDYGCTLKVMTGELARSMRRCGEMPRVIPALAAELGARIAEMPVHHRPRKHGTSKYGISRTIRVILDLLTVKFLLGYSKRPIHLFGPAGLLSLIGGVGLLGVLTFQRMFMSVPMGNRPLLALGILLILMGLQFLMFGLLAELLARTYYESQNKSVYVVRRILERGVDLLNADTLAASVVQESDGRSRKVTRRENAALGTSPARAVGGRLAH